jgi:hypothetical protein
LHLFVQVVDFLHSCLQLLDRGIRLVHTFLRNVSKSSLLADFLLSLLVKLFVVLGEFSEDFSTCTLERKGFHLLQHISAVLSFQNRIHVPDHFLSENGSVGRQNLKRSSTENGNLHVFRSAALV